jgi:hypothetical protein
MLTSKSVPSHGRRRSTVTLLIVVLTAVIALALGVGAGATLPSGSTFESGDGNLQVDATGNHDWNNPVQPISCPSTIPAAGTNCGTDLTKSTSDNAFGQGAKEDIPNPSEVTGSVPPNKSDLTRFYVNKEKAGHDFLYLAWERSNVLGSANMDFEFNQSATLPTGKNTPLRTDGDLLITFDFTNGGAKPVLGLLHWVTTGNKSQCFSASALPCWGNRVDLSAAGFAEGQINAGTVHDANPPPAGGTDLAASTFGEAGIDLTAANIFPQGTCVHFGSAFLKSRSSASFTAELKDFIAPVPVNISNCGGLSVHKYIDINENASKDTGEASVPPVLTADLGGWSFTVTGPNSFTCTGTTDATGNLASCLKPDATAADLAALGQGNYTITENANASKTIGSNASAFFNTDPGPAPATAPVSKSNVAVALGGTVNRDFGNSCYATANFEVDDVPSGQSGLFVRYTVNSDLTTHDVALTQVGTTSTYTAAAGGLRRSDSISWSFGINHNTADEQTKAALTPISLSGYPSCSGSGSVSFGNTTISGLKYKDINGDGSRQVATENGMQGFSFQLKSGSTVLDTQTSGATGAFSFSSVAPGTYTIHEVHPLRAGWQQTQPAADGDVTVTVNLADATVTTDSSDNDILFGNTPLSDISVTFNPHAKLLNADGTESTTDATQPTSFSCTDARASALTLTGTGNTRQTSNLQIKQSFTTDALTTDNGVVCVVKFTDP